MYVKILVHWLLVKIWRSYQYKHLVALYIEDLPCIYNHNYPKCFYNCNHHTDKHYVPYIHKHLNHIKRCFTIVICLLIKKATDFSRLQQWKQIYLPSHLLLPSPWNPTGQLQPFTTDSFIQKGNSISFEACPGNAFTTKKGRKKWRKKTRFG